MTGEKVAVAMSGGVDSTVTAAILRNEGLAVRGLFMVLDLEDGTAQADKVRAAADRIGVELEVVDLHHQFAGKVLDYFRTSYFAGLTPNPCVICNRQIKFGLLAEKALAGGAQFMATGHYARLRRDDRGVVHLLKGVDPAKDQSYFLCMLGQEQLARVRFPLGEFHKDRVYDMAEALGLDFSRGDESQDVCFLKDRSVADYLGEAGGSGPGEVVDPAGRKLGSHPGVHRFTIGQRRGLGIPDATPWYVIGLDVEGRQVVVGKEEDLFGAVMTVGPINWLAGAPPADLEGIGVRIRYRHEPAPAAIRLESAGSATVIFEQPQRAITPGQFAAFYRGEELLGGGVITGSS